MTRRLKATAPIPFASEGQDWFLPLLIGLLQYLLAILLIVFLVFNGLVQRWDVTLNHHVTLEIMQSNATPIDPLIDYIKADPAIKGVSIVSDKQLAITLQPWLGNVADEIIDNLPLPRLVDLELKEGVSFNVNTMLLQLKQKFPDQQVDISNSWAAEILSLIKGLRILASFLLVLLVLIVVIVVFFTVRSRLKIHFDEIELLHVTGASDQFIARLFQRQIRGSAVKGALLGLILFGVTAGLFSAYNAMQPSDLLLNSIIPLKTMALPLLIAVLALPLFILVVASLTARFSVMRFLKTLF